MDHPACAGETGDVRLGFDQRVRSEFIGSKISSVVGLLLFRGLDDVLGLHDLSVSIMRDTRTGHNRLHSLVGLPRQSVIGRLTGYENVNDAHRPALDPVMLQEVGERAMDGSAASTSQMARFETEGYYANRLRANRVLQCRFSHLLKRPVGRPPKGVKRIYHDFEYKLASIQRLRTVGSCMIVPVEKLNENGSIGLSMRRLISPKSRSTRLSRPETRSTCAPDAQAPAQRTKRLERRPEQRQHA
jgi:Transposase DDE domain group 1